MGMPTRLGTVTVSTKVDRETASFLVAEANRLEISQAELLRRAVDHIYESRAGELSCPHCERELNVSL